LTARFLSITYDEQSERLSSESTEATSALREVTTNETHIDELPALLTVRYMIDWIMGGSVFRSEATASTGAISVGLTYSQTNGFGTGQSSTFFNILAVFETDNSSLASPTGFEPVLPP
jgi:hypothetical protein